jgi:hypothetical protein
MKTEETKELVNLSLSELIEFSGGSEHSESVFTFFGYVVKGFFVFATEGGRNAGLCVR